MSYWNYFPGAGKYAKKSLTKKQLQQIKENYEKWDAIIAHVKQLEEKEKEKGKHDEKLDETLNSILL